MYNTMFSIVAVSKQQQLRTQSQHITTTHKKTTECKHKLKLIILSKSIILHIMFLVVHAECLCCCYFIVFFGSMPKCTQRCALLRFGCMVHYGYDVVVLQNKIFILRNSLDIRLTKTQTDGSINSFGDN